MKKFLGIWVSAALAAMAAAANATTVTNLDNEAHTLVVTEGGQQVEVEISAGDTIEICPTGCFVVLPNGDRQVLTGTERLEIEASRGRIF